MRKHNELWDLIKAKGTNCRRLSFKFGYTPTVVYQWTYGDKEPCAMDMIRLAEELQISVEKVVRIIAEGAV